MQEELISEIKSNFSLSSIPTGNISKYRYNDEYTREYFLGTKWNEHSVKDLRIHVSSLSFFTPQAFKYYLPAFMLAEIENPIEADIIVFSIMSAILNEKNLLEVFTCIELKIIERFMKFCQKRYPHHDDFEFGPKFCDVIKLIMINIDQRR